MRSRCLAIPILGVLALLLAAPAVAQPVKLISESYQIPGRDPGIQLYVRNKRPEGMTAFTPDRIVLFVHGATYPAETAFDLQLDGLSWMDYIAQRGYDVYLMDVRGYGRSTRPPEMAQPARENRPIVHTDVAVTDFGTVVDHILTRRRVEDSGPGAPDSRGVGRRHARVYVAGPLRAVDRRSRQAVCGHRRGDAHGRHGAEPDAPVP